MKEGWYGTLPLKEKINTIKKCTNCVRSITDTLKEVKETFIPLYNEEELGGVNSDFKTT